MSRTLHERLRVAARRDRRRGRQRSSAGRNRAPQRLRGRGRPAAAARCQRRDRRGQRHAGLLQGDRHTAEAWTVVHRPRSAAIAASRAAQRGGGEALVSRSGPNRETRALRRTARSRRHRRRRAAARRPASPRWRSCSCRMRSARRRSVRIVVRALGDPLALAPAIRDQIRALDPNLPLAEAVPSKDMVSRSVARPRFYMSLLTLFAAVALVLSATGIFGVMSYAVAQQSKEIGIRMALGARAGDVLRSVVGRALALAGLGVLVGLAASLLLGRIIHNQLFGVRRVRSADADRGRRGAAGQRGVRKPAARQPRRAHRPGYRVPAISLRFKVYPLFNYSFLPCPCDWMNRWPRRSRRSASRGRLALRTQVRRHPAACL